MTKFLKSYGNDLIDPDNTATITFVSKVAWAFPSEDSRQSKNIMDIISDFFLILNSRILERGRVPENNSRISGILTFIPNYISKAHMRCQNYIKISTSHTGCLE